ncbi:hypothetical protein AM588_10002826 [Phytophthora nicotianae]|uniref:UBX domain-containing protein n=1 Tax=Phytophthora nicotianae TaxID=4792 RepID=A0A0W8D3P0_PHYNI|nr:hypothetical protein AM588_10002826 [Phytophthora nicotianae]
MPVAAHIGGGRALLLLAAKLLVVFGCAVGVVWGIFTLLVRRVREHDAALGLATSKLDSLSIRSLSSLEELQRSHETFLHVFAVQFPLALTCFTSVYVLKQISVRAAADALLDQDLAPNISSQTGAICLDILKDAWSPALTIKTALLSIQALLSAAEPTDPQDAEVAKMYLHDHEQFLNTARFWTESYAKQTETGDDAALSRLIDMGFPADKAKAALQAANGDENAAIEKLKEEEQRRVEEEKQRQEEEKTRREEAYKAEIEAKRARIADGPKSRTPPPGADYKTAVIKFHLHNGTRLDHIFYAHDTLKTVRDFIDVEFFDREISIRNYELATNFPKKVYGPELLDVTLTDAGLAPQALVFVQDLDS